MLVELLKLMQSLRAILIQDAALLYAKDPNCGLWSYMPFRSVEFRQFSADAVQRIQVVEEERHLALLNLPTQLSNSMKGLIEHSGHQQHRLQEQQLQAVGALSSQVSHLTGLVEELRSDKAHRTRHGRKRSGKQFGYILLEASI